MLLGIDVLLIAVAHALATSLLIGYIGFVNMLDSFLVGACILMAVGLGLIAFLGLHKIKLNAYQMQGVVESAFVAAVITGSGVAYSVIATPPSFPAPLYVVTGMLFLILSVTSRLFMRQALLMIYRRGNPRVPIIIYGAGQTGQQLATALAVDDAVEPIAFVDDDRRLQSLTVAGLRVYAPVEIQDLVDRYDVRRIILAMPSAKRAVQTAITRRLVESGCEVHALPSFSDLIANKADSLSDTKPVDVHDLLGRERLEQELPGVSGSYRNRNILVTGAGGSIGSELCRQLVGCKPSKLILLDHSELALFDVHRELATLSPETPIVPILGSVCERGLVVDAMERNKIDVVLHAAAYKHVPLVEENALEGIRVNVFGTKTVADAARLTGVERFILVSTDKAVRPSSMMGVSKRFAEMAVQDLATRSTTTRFSMVRFGNVLGSSGSVIPLFQEQIARGGPVTLTHSDVTRFFMTIPEAVRLVLLAGSFARGGDVFVLDMGKPVPIRKLAEKMIRNAGYSVRDAENPEGEIEIEITGLRPGEKLHEELLIGSDMLTTPHPKILRAQESHLSEIEMANALQALRQSLDTRSEDLLKQTLDQWIERQGDDKVASRSVNL
ncbi:polysaccharide biosynthesis protein [Roseovarius aestuariivivens]|uniref:polysaccharide biosynthesis protein n=1 Tax=Roseovarius aestuariivivens TaxID=1888910 RepID=UPI001FD8F8F9|nr:nucleoside-diphosphate sugar epimerase/dehydratase [Roseovarius aestuariivivens]